MENLKKGQQIFFTEEKLPMIVRAISENYAVCTRKFDKVEDSDLIDHKIRMKAYSSRKSAENNLKNEHVYSIIDFKNQTRGPHNMVFNLYDFDLDSDMELIIRDLECGDLEISSHNSCKLNIVNII